MFGWERHDQGTGKAPTGRLWWQTRSMTWTSQHVRQPFSLVVEVIDNQPVSLRCSMMSKRSTRDDSCRVSGGQPDV